VLNKLKILTVNHHTAYLYSLAKTGHAFYVLGGWDHFSRPIPENFQLISWDEVRKVIGQVDIFIGHQITADVKGLFPKCIRAGKPYIQVIHGRKARTGHSRSKMKRVVKRIYASSILKTLEWSGLVRFVFVSDYDKSDWPMSGVVIDLGIPVGEMYDYKGNKASLLVVGNALKREHFDLESLMMLREKIPVKITGETTGLAESRPAGDWDELRTFYSEYRVFLNLTREPEKGYNTATLEAMATGMPVISLDHPFTPIKDGWNGYLVKDLDALVEKSSLLLNDLGLARRLGENARKTAKERYHVDTFVERWNAVLEESCKCN